jgi:hypothetical protein
MSCTEWGNATLVNVPWIETNWDDPEPKKEINKMTSNILRLTDKELMDMQCAVQEEVTRRQKRKQEIAWEKVVSAIRDYVEEFDSILVNGYDDDLFIDRQCDFQTFGRIDINYD